MRVRIGKRSWSVEFVRAHDLQSRGNWGECDYPTARAPKVTVRRGLPPRQLLEVTLHELLHASRPELSEEAVTETAQVLARTIFRLGARITPPE